MNHFPERTCIVCRTKGPKTNFFKIVRTADQKIHFDQLHKINGRSLYLCKKERCIQRILQNKKGDPFYYHLKVKLSPEEKTKLLAELQQLLPC